MLMLLHDFLYVIWDVDVCFSFVFLQMVSVSFLRGFADDVTDTVSLKRQTKSRQVEC